MAKPCKYCGRETHFSFQCGLRPRKEKPKKPQKPIRFASKKSAKRKRDVDKEWHEQNPPNEKGLWPCYLRISPDCEVWVDAETINLEHKKSKVRHPELKYVVSNIGATCNPCNKQKGSLDDDDVL